MGESVRELVSELSEAGEAREREGDVLQFHALCLDQLPGYSIMP